MYEERCCWFIQDKTAGALQSVDQRSANIVEQTRRCALLQIEDFLNNGDLVRRRDKAGKRTPIVDRQTGADNFGAAVDSAGDKRDLEKRCQLLLVLDRGFGMDNGALIRERTIRADENIAGNRLPKHLDTENVDNDFLGFFVEIGMDQSDVIIANNHITKRRKTLLDTLHYDSIGQRVANMQQFLVRCSIWL